ncbi:MAG: hypothetical protein L6R41_008060, partial [Letrouitia leprolyta]
KEFARLKEENPELVQAAQRHQSVVSGMEDGRKGSIIGGRKGSVGLPGSRGKSLGGEAEKEVGKEVGGSEGSEGEKTG